MEKHGGQDINIKINLIDDFSVTTNFLGLSEIGKKEMFVFFVYKNETE